MACFPGALPEYMTSISGSPGSRFGVLAGGVSRIYDLGFGVAGESFWRCCGVLSGGVSRIYGRDVGVARELSVSLVSRPGSVNSGPSQSTAPRLALQQTSSLKVGTPPPPNPSGVPLGRRAVPFVLGGGWVHPHLLPETSGIPILPSPHTHRKLARNRSRPCGFVFAKS